MAERWTGELWAQVEDVFDAVLTHPFLAGLTSGDLPAENFAYYVAQDAHYLRDYAKALAAVAAAAPTHAITGAFAAHAASTVQVELTLHGTLLGELGLAPETVDATPVSPTTTAYTSYLLAHTRGGYVEGLATVLPCFWIYQRVGEALLERGSPDPRYTRWIETYASPEFAASVEEVIGLADAARASASEQEAARAARHFVTTSCYEWMFWDAAWRRETWPVGQPVEVFPDV